MWFHDEQLRILKDLIVEQQKDPDEEIFLKIVERVDPLLAELVGRFSKTYYYREPTPQLLQDMYQVAVSSLERVIREFKTEASPSVVPSWIFHVVRNELFKVYGVRRFDASKYYFEHPNCSEEPDNDYRLIQEDICKIIQNLISRGRISQEDYDLFHLVRVERISVCEILRSFGDKWGGCHATIKKKLDSTQRILREEFEKNGFDHA